MLTAVSVLCPNFEGHTAEPEVYLAWHSWAEDMSKTHRQIKCTGCGLYRIWLPKTEKQDG